MSRWWVKNRSRVKANVSHGNENLGHKVGHKLEQKWVIVAPFQTVIFRTVVTQSY
jgi:hypothetical protein